jgi:hypothetical protein
MSDTETIQVRREDFERAERSRRENAELRAEIGERTSARDHIADPTMKVKAPDALLSALGRANVNAMMNTARLREVCVLLGVDAGAILGSAQPATVIMFARSIDEWQVEHERLLRLILDGLGHIAFDENGEVSCVGPCDKHTSRSYDSGEGWQFCDDRSGVEPQMMGPETVLQPVE